jgi:hypothetical protein
MRKLSDVQLFIKAMFDVNDKVNGAGRFETPFPDANDCQELINFLIDGSHIELGCIVSRFDILTDSSDLIQGFREVLSTGREIEENTILACAGFMNEIKTEIDDIEEVNEMELNDNIIPFKIIGSRS